MFDSNASYIPKNTSFIKLNNNLDISDVPEIKKVATHQVIKDSAGLYRLQGP